VLPNIQSLGKHESRNFDAVQSSCPCSKLGVCFGKEHKRMAWVKMIEPEEATGELRAEIQQGKTSWEV
jgi:hypothetical protein